MMYIGEMDNTLQQQPVYKIHVKLQLRFQLGEKNTSTRLGAGRIANNTNLMKTFIVAFYVITKNQQDWTFSASPNNQKSEQQ